MSCSTKRKKLCGLEMSVELAKIFPSLIHSIEGYPNYLDPR
jgi:hypothetical protein